MVPWLPVGGCPKEVVSGGYVTRVPRGGLLYYCVRCFLLFLCLFILSEVIANAWKRLLETGIVSYHTGPLFRGCCSPENGGVNPSIVASTSTEIWNASVGCRASWGLYKKSRLQYRGILVSRPSHTMKISQRHVVLNVRQPCVSNDPRPLTASELWFNRPKLLREGDDPYSETRRGSELNSLLW